MQFAQDQTLIAPVVSVPPRPDKIAIPVEESSRKVVETGKQFVNTPTISIIKPYFQQMAERTYPWIERDTVYNLQHELQNFDICLPRPLEESPIESTVWVLYVPLFHCVSTIPESSHTFTRFLRCSISHAQN